MQLGKPRAERPFHRNKAAASFTWKTTFIKRAGFKLSRADTGAVTLIQRFAWGFSSKNQRGATSLKRTAMGRSDLCKPPRAPIGLRSVHELGKEYSACKICRAKPGRPPQSCASTRTALASMRRCAGAPISTRNSSSSAAMWREGDCYPLAAISLEPNSQLARITESVTAWRS